MYLLFLSTPYDWISFSFSFTTEIDRNSRHFGDLVFSRIYSSFRRTGRCGLELDVDVVHGVDGIVKRILIRVVIRVVLALIRRVRMSSRLVPHADNRHDRLVLVIPRFGSLLREQLLTKVIGVECLDAHAAEQSVI